LLGIITIIKNNYCIPAAIKDKNYKIEKNRLIPISVWKVVAMTTPEGMVGIGVESGV
jgi:hypothetical protein